MKIEDAIKRYESWAEDDRIDVLIRKEHRQMADWLKELKANRPQGEWIEIKRYWEINQWVYEIECSVCKERIKNPYEPHFCPNCGADMRGENNETDKEMR